MSTRRMVTVSTQVCFETGEQRVSLGPEAFEATESDAEALTEATERFEEMLKLPFRAPQISAVHPLTDHTEE